MWLDPRLSVAGLFVGALVGATGMGGGSLLTPLLVMGFGFNPTVAVGTDLLHGGIFKTFGVLRHRRLGTVQAQLSGWMLLGSGPSSLLGVWLASSWRHGASSAPRIQMLVLGGTLLLGGIGMLLKALLKAREPRSQFVMRPRERVTALLIGIIGGFIVGLTSVGSGVFFALTMLLVFPLRSAKVVGTDLLHSAALLWIAGAAHLAMGNVDLRAVGALLLGSVPGVLMGSSICVRLSDRRLRLTLGFVLILSGLKMIELPASSAILITGLTLLLVFGLVACIRPLATPFAQQLRRRRPIVRQPGVKPRDPGALGGRMPAGTVRFSLTGSLGTTLHEIRAEGLHYGIRERSVRGGDRRETHGSGQ